MYNKKNDTRAKGHSRSWLPGIYLAAALCVVSPLATHAQADKVCFPPHIGLPRLYLPPTVDGFVEPELGRTVTPPPPGTLPLVETGWTRSPRVTYVSSASESMVSFQALKHNSQDYVYLNFLVHYDPSFDNQDAIVLVFRPRYWQTPGVPISTKSGDERRIDIRPVLLGIGAHQTGYTDPNDDNFATPRDPTTARLRTNRNPQSVNYYRWDMSTNAWVSLTMTATGMGTNELKQSEFTNNIKVRSWDAGTNNKNWFVEVELPTRKANGGAGWIDLDTSFGFYFNVLRVCNALPCQTPSQVSPSQIQTNALTEYTWPRADYTNGFRLIHDPTATMSLIQFEIPATWLGEAILGGTTDCRGVRFASGHSSIGTQNPANPTGPLSTNINTTAGSINVFEARVINDGSTDAQLVTAEFRHADWGIQNPDLGYWNLIRATGGTTNPTPPAATIPAGVVTPTGLTMQWELDANERIRYAPPKHECVAVRLTSTADVIFAESQMWNNLNYVALSKHSQGAVVSAKGYPAPPSGWTDQSFLLLASELRLDSTSMYSGWERGKITRIVRGQPTSVRVEEEERDVLPPLNPTAAEIFGRWAQTRDRVSSTIWLLNGYRITNFLLNIDGTNYHLYEATNNFGFVGEHKGPTKYFSARVSGGGVRQVGKRAWGAWRIQVPDGGEARITTKLEASSAPKCLTLGGINVGLLLLVGLVVIGLLIYRLRRKK